MSKWTKEDLGSQSGKTAIITGGSSGIGFETAKALAVAGARVIIASDREDRGLRAADAIRRLGGDIEFLRLDTSDLESVRDFASRIASRLSNLHILVNNAGLAEIPVRLTTSQGFEKQFATNYLGHFALTGMLLPLLSRTPNARVVGTSSLAHRKARIHFEDLQLARDYDPMMAYGQSKLAMLMFSLELARRAQMAAAKFASIAVHPGGARTEIQKKGAFMGGRPNWQHYLLKLEIGLFGQSAAQGALPLLFAAASPLAMSGEYYGPDGFHEVRGNPKLAEIFPQARDLRAAARLWEMSEHLTGIKYRWDVSPEAPLYGPKEDASFPLHTI